MLNINEDEFTVFMQSAMSSLQVDGLKNKIAKIRLDQAAYNNDIEAQVQDIQQQINTLEANVIKAA